MRAGVERMIVVSIIGTDRFTDGYNGAKAAQEQLALAGPIPAQIVRAAQFHEFVAQLVDWGRQGDTSYVWKMRTQLIAARALAEELVRLATDPDPGIGSIVEVAGPREESLVEAAQLLVAQRGENLRIEGVSAPGVGDLYESGAVLPGPRRHPHRPHLRRVARGGSARRVSTKPGRARLGLGRAHRRATTVMPSSAPSSVAIRAGDARRPAAIQR